MKRFNLIIIILFFHSIILVAQSNDEVEMADILRRDGKIYSVVFGVVVILTAMIILLLRVDRKVYRLEKEIKKEG
jgi:hypothetical protein